MRWAAVMTMAGVTLVLVGGAAIAKSGLPPCPDFLAAVSPVSSVPPAFAPLCDDWDAFGDRLQALGIAVGAKWVMEGFKNFRGGVTTAGAVPASTLDLLLSVDTRPLLGLPGGEFHFDLQDHAGDNPTTDLVGDLQIFDKLNYTPYLQVFEIWYQQRMFGNRLRIKVGKIDANTEFSVITNGLRFLSSSTQQPPTLGFIFPTTPDPMPGVNLFFTPGKLFYASFGAFYSNSGDRFLDFTGDPWAAQPTRNGAFLIGETGLTWRALPQLEAPGDFKLGLWGHTGSFRKFDGREQHGTEGIYSVLDQTLWQATAGGNRGRALRGFIEYGRTNQSVSPISGDFGGGLTWTGFPYRPYDAIGLSPQYALLSPEARFPHDYELALETFYRLHLTSEFALQADLQYIANPGGHYPDALVGTMQLVVNLWH